MRRLSLAVLAALLLLQAPMVRAVPLQADQPAAATQRDPRLFDFDWRFRAGEVEGGQAIGLSDTGDAGIKCRVAALATRPSEDRPCVRKS
jgi:hypothetical protein